MGRLIYLKGGRINGPSPSTESFRTYTCSEKILVGASAQTSLEEEVLKRIGRCPMLAATQVVADYGNWEIDI